MPRLRLTIRRRIAVAALGAAVVFGAAAAAAGAQAPPAPTGWQRTDLRPVTQPAPVGGLLVLYVSAHGGLRVLGLDPGTGRTVWSQLASPGDVTPGLPPSLGVFGANVVYLARGVSSTARVVAADARTGVPVWQSGLGSFSTFPGPCVDAPSAVCVSGSLAGGRKGVELRFDAATGAPLPSPDVPGLDAREVGPGILESAEARSRLSAVRGGAVAWTRRVTAIFPGAEPGFGWNLDRIEGLGLFVGTIAPASETHGSRVVFDLADERTAGFRIADGRVVWRQRGSYLCRLVPCPGQSQAGYNVNTSPPALGIRTVSTGTFSGRADSDRPLTLSRDARVTLEGFDPATGGTRWRFRGDVSLIDATDVGAQTGPLTIALLDDRGRVRALDLRSGRRSRPPATGWCRRDITYRQTVGFDTEDGTLHEYVGQPGLLPCSAATERRIATPSPVPAFVGAIGAAAAGLVAWTDTGGVFARPAGP